MKISFLLSYVLLVHAFYGAWCSVGGSLHCEYSNSQILHRPHSVSITEFGAVGDGVTLNTKAFQNALFYLNTFSDKGGAKLFVPAGQWLTGSFDLISHLTLWLDKGATILGSTNSENWPVVDPLPSYGRGRELPGRRHRSLIYGQNLTDVVITGENGTIDGQGSIWWDWFRNGELNYTRPHLVELINATGLIISNLTFLNSPFWNIHPVYCRDVFVKNLTILAPLDSPNTDGVDPDSSTNVCIEDCYIVTGDDLVSIKSGWDEYGISYARPSSKIKINRLTGQTTSSSGIAIGSEMSGGVSDIYIKDLHLFNSNTGIRIKTSPGRGGYVRNVHVSNVKLDNVQKAIRFTGKYGEHPDGNFDTKALPAIEKITFENVSGEDIGVAGLLEGIEGDEFKNICFLNVTLRVKKNSKQAPWRCSNVRGYSQWVSPEISCDSFEESIFPEHSSDCFGLSENNVETSSGLSRSPWLFFWYVNEV
ncbi:probable polygalacturonase [Brassica napus]|uniref:probable polygalacturonase n=1 Tax=Brassica napus TaxID=3708 RepID=UPI00207A3F54|nr:probable polygalacturonase [Brassica napus]XP_013749460.2 probable polygalacturonase [Brassica napus]XP_013749461.2 probable polygalacturonase [Brassica napus]